MLQFWKKDKQKSPQSSPCKVPNGNVNAHGSVTDVFNQNNSNLSSQSTNQGSCSERCVSKSRLTLELKDVLENKSALSYFSHFLEARGFTYVLCLWLDLEQIVFPLKTLTMKKSQLPLIATQGIGKQEDYKNKRSEKDMIPMIMEHYLNENSPLKVRISDELRSEILTHSEDSSFCVNLLKDFVFQTLSKEVWSEFVQSDWYSKYIVEVMTSGTMTLSDVLFSDTCLSNFIEFLEQEGLISLVEFWLAATSFEKQFTLSHETPVSQIQNDAIIIYEKYVSLESRSRVGLSDKVRICVEEGICTDEREVLRGCFEPAVIFIEQLMRDTLLCQYLSSQHYLSLLSDMVMGTPGTTNVPSPPMSTSSHDTTNTASTEHLWRRNKHSCGLSFGRIDQLGRYVADFEPEPDKKVSHLGKILKIFTSKDEERVHEEMAWRVAEMIVKDITNITLGSQADEEI